MAELIEFQQELVDKLAQIGYSKRHCGCGYYQIINDVGRKTEFIFDSEKIEMKNDVVFGMDRRYNKYREAGSVVFHFKKCKMEVMEGDSLYISSLDGGIFIAFRRVKDLPK